MKVDVRCCCDAGRLIGFIELPDGFNCSQCLIPFRTRGGAVLSLEMDRIQSYGERKFAIKGHELPVEALECIPEFTRATVEDLDKQSRETEFYRRCFRVPDKDENEKIRL